MNDIRIRGGSPDRFSYFWSIFSEILPEHHEQFIRWTAALPREAWERAYFLYAGRGIGRNSFQAMQASATGGVACDIDERSLAVARKNLKNVRKTISTSRSLSVRSTTSLILKRHCDA
jgi:predicted RNA methylase